VQRQAWQWALAHRGEGGALPTGKMIAARFGRHKRWGRVVKRSGQQQAAKALRARTREQPTKT
jgi:hypothetical protein